MVIESIKNKRLNIFITLIVLLILVFIIFALNVNSHLNDIEKIAKATFSIKKNLAQSIDQIDKLFKPSASMIAFVHQEDINRIKEILFSFNNTVDKTIQYSHHDVINIVDRVNLYVTIGVVLLTLMGMFLPLIINNFAREEMSKKYAELKDELKNEHSKLEYKQIELKDNLKKQKDDLKKNQDDLKNEIKSQKDELQQFVRDSELKIKNGTTEELTTLKDQIKFASKEAENVAPLRLSQNLSLALNKDFIRWYVKSPEHNRKYFKELFIGIYEDLEECNHKKIVIPENKTLIYSFKAFNFNLKHIIEIYQTFDRERLGEFKNFQKKVEGFVNKIDKKNMLQEDLDEIINATKVITKSFIPERSPN
jgi:ABC-type multidrug transport system fused ATPase/permease subunit